MGILVKRRGNDEYLYFLYGKKQLYLGRKDDPDSINQANLLKGTSALDKSMDAELKKYVNSVLMCAKYMDKKNDDSYLNKRRLEMERILSRLK